MAVSIEDLVFIGFMIGLVGGLVTRNRPVGCTILALVPALMIAYVAWWQSQHPENLRSTSALDFIFGPLWPTAGALGGFGLAKWLQSIFDKQKNS